MRSPSYALAPLLVSVLLGCGSSSTTSSTTGITPSVCASDPRAEAYSVGLSSKAAAGGFTVKYLDANPAPPERDLNQWMIEVDDSNGKPVEGAMIDVKLWMPDHKHGCTACPSVMDMGKGQYQVTEVDFFMPGIWQVTFTVTPPGGTKDAAVFTFCIDG